MLFGYARVSTKKQSITRQIENIKKYANGKDVVIYQEAYSGTKMNRPEWMKLLKRVKSGDTIIFDEISRMSRQAEEGYNLYKQLYEDGVNLVFLKERSLDTEHFRNVQEIAKTGEEIADTLIEAVNKILWLLAEKQVKAAFEGAEHEAEFNHKRTRDGMLQSGAGHKISEAHTGMKYKIKKETSAKAKILKYSKDFEGSMSDLDCIAAIGISRNTYYKYKKELFQEEFNRIMDENND